MFFRFLVVSLLGLTIGALSALWFGGMVKGGPMIGDAINVDNWRTDWSIGSENANPYVRARVARNGLMGLRKEEAVYFIRTEDDQGARLTEDCSYRVSGGAFPAQWWSITLYDGDNRLPMNTDRRLSFDQTQADALFAAQAPNWEFLVARTAPESPSSPWVSSRAGGAFDLTLRLYQPSDALLDQPARALVPPQVQRLNCDAEVG
jgi:hypothetical protein